MIYLTVATETNERFAQIEQIFIRLKLDLLFDLKHFRIPGEVLGYASKQRMDLTRRTQYIHEMYDKAHEGNIFYDPKKVNMFYIAEKLEVKVLDNKPGVDSIDYMVTKADLDSCEALYNQLPNALKENPCATRVYRCLARASNNTVSILGSTYTEQIDLNCGWEYKTETLGYDQMFVKHKDMHSYLTSMIKKIAQFILFAEYPFLRS